MQIRKIQKNKGIHSFESNLYLKRLIKKRSWFEWKTNKNKRSI